MNENNLDKCIHIPIDPMAYEQSKNLIFKTAYMYYHCAARETEIATRLGISVTTVSRLLKKARKDGMVKFIFPAFLTDCLLMEEELRNYYGLKDVIVAPVEPGEGTNLDEIKKLVALEGARYIQRIISPEDTLGIAWGGTMWYLCNFLNPCLKIGTKFVTLHGTIQNIQNKFNAAFLVPRIAKAFCGKAYCINCRGFQKSEDDVKKAMEIKGVRQALDCFKDITISVSGVGVFHPQRDSILATNNFLAKHELRELERAGVYGDLVLRFFDKDGRECETSMKNKVVGISWENYMKIPTKIIVASGRFKADAVLALIKGKLVDVLIIDQELGREIQGRMGK